jgi:hypothetical protein
MKVITIPNLDRYQHYRDRNIIWVKLYLDILQDHKFQQLNDVERWLFIGLILLAVKNDNKIPADFQYIGKILMFSKKNLPKHIINLLQLGLISFKMLSRCSIDKIREDKIREYKKDIFKKRYYHEEEMIFKWNKWWVIPKDGGKWLEFVGDLKETEFK